MNILYIGQIVPIEKIKKCTGYSVAGDIMQKNLLKELMCQSEIEDICMISVLPNAAFPRDRIWISNDQSKYCEGVVYNLSYCNIPGVKQYHQKKSIYKFACAMAKKKKFDCIVCYNMYVQFGEVALKLAKKLDIPLVPILADLPVENIKENSSIFNRWQQLIIKKITFKNIQRVRHAIVLNENAVCYMADKNDYLVISGGVEKEQTYLRKQKFGIERKVIYAGALSTYSGILNLISAIIQSDVQNIFLEIYGDGDLRNEIIHISEKTPMIKYMGTRNINDMRSIMEKAWILVNPRSVEDPVSTISFPSKLFEYITCMRPVVTTEFMGMPESIKKIVFSCGKGTVEEIKETIKEISMTSEEILDKKTEEAYRYVVDEMNWEKQAEKILVYLRTICTCKVKGDNKE